MITTRATRIMIFGSACSGVGCIDLGLERAGHRCAWQIEISPRRRDVLARHWPGVPRHEDLETIDADDLASVDLLVGGTPCQGLSVAGRRQGLASKRSGLFFSFIRLADQLPAKWILWENVPGALSSNDGEDFAVCLEGFTGFRPGVPGRGWRGAGFCAGPLRWCAWRVLDAQYFGVPQRRRRVFVVAGPRDRPAPEVLFERQSVPWASPPSKAPGEIAACLLAHGPGGGSRVDDNESLIVHGGPAVTPGGEAGVAVYSRAGAVAPTLTSSDGKSDSQAGKSGDPGVCVVYHRRDPWQVRILTPVERERLQGLPDGWTERGGSGAEMSWSSRRRMTGDGAAVSVFHWIGLRLAKASHGSAL